MLTAAFFLYFSHNRNVVAVEITFFELILNRWIFDCSLASKLLTESSICLFLSLSLHPVSTCLTHCWSSLFVFTTHPHHNFPANIFEQQEGAEVPSKEQSPLGVLYESSGGRVAAPGSGSTFYHPPNQVQSHPVCPCFSSSSSFFFKTLYNEVQFLLMEGCFINAVLAQSGFFTHKRTMRYPPTNFILNLLIYYEWGNAVGFFFIFSLPDTVFEKAFKGKPWWQQQKINGINERKWNIFLFCRQTSLILWASGFT